MKTQPLKLHPSVLADDLNAAIQEHCKIPDYSVEWSLKMGYRGCYYVDSGPWDMFTEDNRKDVEYLTSKDDQMELIRCYVGHLCHLGLLPEGSLVITSC